MSTLTHFSKHDATRRTKTGDTNVSEVTQYTVAFSDLTGAGFAAGDDVLILCMGVLGCSSASTSARFRVGRGTTFAGRTDWTESIHREEGTNANTAEDNPGVSYTFMERHTLVNSENIYFGIDVETAAQTATFDNFQFVVLKLGDLDSADYAYAENTGTAGNAPTAYDNTGASVTLGVGDWLILAVTHWLVDATVTSTLFMAINDGTSDLHETQLEGEEANDELTLMSAYYESIPSGTKTYRVRYRTSAASHDCNSTKIFALDLSQFTDRSATIASGTITHSAADTFQECAGHGAHPVTVNGDHLILGVSFHNPNEDTTKRPYCRIQVGGADAVASLHRAAQGLNGPTSGSYKHPVAAMVMEPLTAGTADIDFDIAEDVDVSPTYTATPHLLVAFSMDMPDQAARGRVPVVVPSIPVHTSYSW